MAHAAQETTVNDLIALNLSKLRSTRQKNISDLSREALFTWRAIRGAGLPTVQRGTVRGSGEGLVKQLAAITGSGGSLHLPQGQRLRTGPCEVVRGWQPSLAPQARSACRGFRLTRSSKRSPLLSTLPGGFEVAQTQRQMCCRLINFSLTFYLRLRDVVTLSSALWM